MFWFSFNELDTLFSIIFIIIYGLLSLRSKQLFLSDTFFFIRLLPILWVIYQNNYDLSSIFSDYTVGNAHLRNITDSSVGSILGIQGGIEFLLAVCVVFIMPSFTAANSFEASLLVLLAFFFQYYMLHSTDLISFFITLEAQNFCFFVLCGMLPFLKSNKHNISMSIEVGLKYLLLSAFSSGILLYGTSLLYLQTGSMQLSTFTHFIQEGQASNLLFFANSSSFASYLILCSILFKLGIAPFHLWMFQIYSGTNRSLILYISTIPKLCIIAFWIMHLQGIISNYTLILFSLLSGFIGATAFVQPNIRYLLVYSSISEIGLLVAALETAGYHALLQHLSIYIISQYLLWNIHSSASQGLNSGTIQTLGMCYSHSQVKRLMPFLAVSLAGLPPLAGFFGKAWVFWHLATVNAVTLLVLTLVFAFVSIVFYLRLLRVTWNTSGQGSTFVKNNVEHLYAGGNADQNNPSSQTYSVVYSQQSFYNSRVAASESSEAALINVNSYNTLKGNNFSAYNSSNPNNSTSLIYAPQGRYSDSRVFLTSTCVVLLIILPFFVMKPVF